MKIKKYISVLLSLILTAACVTLPASAEEITETAETTENGETVKEDINNYKAARVLTALGLIEEPKASDDWSEKKLTNAEFLKIVLSMTYYSGDSSYNVILPWEGYESGTEYYNIYAYAYLNALLQEGDDIGAPEDALTFDFAKSFMMKLMGYYPEINNSQRKEAEGELVKNVRRSDDGTISLNDVYAMMYAATTIDSYHMETVNGKPGYVLRDGRSILSYNKDIYMIKGKVNATQYASLNGAKAYKGQLVINNDIFVIDDSSYEILIGKTVTGYAFIKNGEDAKVLYLETMENRSGDIVIAGKDFVSFSGRQVTYYTGNGRNKVQTVDNPVIIYNGKQVESGQYTDEIFNIIDGDVTLVRNGGDIGIIIVNKYKNIIVGSVDATKKKVYDAVYQGVSLDLDKTDVYIKNLSGNIVEAADLKNGSVLTYAESFDGDYINGTVGGIMLTGKMDSVDRGEDGSVTISGKTYPFTAEAESIKDALMIGVEYTFYINVNGRLAAVKNSRGVSGEMAYLLKSYSDMDKDDITRLKVIKPDALDQNDAVLLDCKSKCKVDGKQYKNEKIAEAIANNNNGSSDFPIIYRIDKAGLVYEIDTPFFNSEYENEDTTLQQRHSAADEYGIFSKSAISMGYRNLYLINTPNRVYESAGAAFIMDFDGMCIQKLAGTGEFNVLDRIKNDSTNTMDLYSIGKESPLVCFSVITSGDKTAPTFEKTMAVVQDKYEAINSDGDVVTMLSLVIKGEVSEYEILESQKENIAPLADEGDIIIYALDPKNRIEKIDRLLDYSDRTSSIGKKTELNDGIGIFVGRVYDVLNTTNMKAGSNNTIIQFAADKSNDDKRVTFARSGATYSYSMEGRKSSKKVVMDELNPNKIKTYSNAGSDADLLVLITEYTIPISIYIVPSKD